MSTVTTIMQTIVPTLKREARISEAAKFLAQDENGCIIIIDNEAPVGIVTTLDVIKADTERSLRMGDSVESIMSSPLTSMAPEMKLEEALKIVDTRTFRRYPVIQNQKLVGLVTKKDIITAVSDNLRFHLNIQTSVLALFVLFELFVFFFYYMPSIL